LRESTTLKPEGADHEAGGVRRRKKPWRCRLADDLRDDVLARLPELNGQRPQEERLRGAAGELDWKSKSKRGSKKGRAAKEDKPDSPTLFDT
jgi:hypothetical protein